VGKRAKVAVVEVVVELEKPAANERLEIGRCRGNSRVQTGFAEADRVTGCAGLCENFLGRILGVELKVRVVCDLFAQGDFVSVAVGREFSSCRS